MLPPDWFFEPRFFNKQNNENFRGLDWRVFSHVDYDAEKKSCAVTCGDRTTDLKIVAADEAQAAAVEGDVSWRRCARGSRTRWLATDAPSITTWTAGARRGRKRAFACFAAPRAR